MSVEDRYRRLFATGDSTDRLEFFSDAVFAIAMTLLVLDIRLPSTEIDDLGEALLDLLPEFFAYVLSFVLIAGTWINHHRKFRMIIGWNNTLLVINLGLLFLVTFVPFPTSVLSDYGGETPAVALYAATLCGLTLMQTVLLVYARRAGLLHQDVATDVYRYMVRNGLVPPLVFAVSIIIALFAPTAAMFSWIAIAPLSGLANRLGRDGDAPGL